MNAGGLAGAPAQSYIICAGPRTGSNLLASALRQTRIAGSALEYFNAATMNGPFMLERLGVAADRADPPDFGARLPEILRAGTQGDVFGATVHWWDKDHLLRAVRSACPEMAAAPGAALLRAALPGLRFLWLRREDKLAQAVSHHTARVSGVWQKRAQAGAGGPPPEIPFDFETIGRLVEDAVLQERGWRDFLAGHEADTLAIGYEEFAADYEGTLTRVLAFLGRAVPPQGLPSPPLQRQADARSAELMALYQAEALHRAVPSGAEAR
jgi:LPS sulfotransferase NodH